MLYLYRNILTIAIEELARAAGESVLGGSAAIFASMLGNTFRESTIQMFLPIIREVSAQTGTNVPDSDVTLPLVKTGYLVYACPPTAMVV